MLKRSIYAALISFGVLTLVLAHLAFSVTAADQTTVLLVQLQSSVTSMTGKLASLDTKVTAMSEQARNERNAVLRRLSDDEQKIEDLANGMADLDAARQNQTVVSLAARTAIIETKLDDAKRDRDKQTAEEKEQHDSLMAWVRPIAMALFGTLLSVLSMMGMTHFRGLKADEDRLRVEDKIDKVREATSDYKDRDESVELAQGVQDARLDVIENSREVE